MGPLESGTYVITSKEDDTLVGRAFVEDLSLRPKAVISLPPGVQTPFWIVEKLRNGHYRLRIRGEPTGVKDKHVYAFLIDDEHDGPEEWVIKHRDFHGPNSYTIERSSGNDGWVLPSIKPDTQISVHRLMATPSAPPQYPLNELWSFIRIDRASD